MTTDELCAEIERLDAAATAGPWNLNGSHVEWEHLTVAQPLRGTRWSLEGHFEITDEQAAANAQLIAAYRTLAVEAAKKLREMQAVAAARETEIAQRDAILARLIQEADRVARELLEDINAELGVQS